MNRSMNDKELERLADLVAEKVFAKLISKQQEMEYKKEDTIKSNQKKIEELRKLRDKAINEENYMFASKINSEIIDLKNFK